MRLIKMIMEAEKWSDGYLIGIFCYYDDPYLKYDELYYPGDIANFIDIAVNNYYETMIRKFNAHLSINMDIYFDNKEDCENAINWLNSVYIMNKLTK